MRQLGLLYNERWHKDDFEEIPKLDSVTIKVEIKASERLSYLCLPVFISHWFYTRFPAVIIAILYAAFSQIRRFVGIFIIPAVSVKLMLCCAPSTSWQIPLIAIKKGLSFHGCLTLHNF